MVINIISVRLQGDTRVGFNKHDWSRLCICQGNLRNNHVWKHASKQAETCGEFVMVGTLWEHRLIMEEENFFILVGFSLKTCTGSVLVFNTR